jgi:hypothetical protein
VRVIAHALARISDRGHELASPKAAKSHLREPEFNDPDLISAAVGLYRGRDQ